jgi:ABC-2 type transport system permease protein
MNIFLRELRANFKSLIIWCVIMALLILIGTAKFAAFYNNPESLQMINALPKSMLDALEMQAFNLTTVTGFFGIMFVYFGLMGAIAAAMWGSDMISKEERDKTVEFSLVLPVSRSRVITAKALAALVNCVVFVLVTWALSLAAVSQYKPEAGFGTFLRLEMEGMFALELIFLALGLLLGCAMKQYKLSGSVAVGVILVTYILSVFAGLKTEWGALKYFTPFKYFDAAEFLRTSALNGGYVLLSAVIVVVFVAAAYLLYNRRDLYI